MSEQQGTVPAVQPVPTVEAQAMQQAEPQMPEQMPEVE